MSSSGTAAPSVDTRGNELRPPLQAWERLEGVIPQAGRAGFLGGGELAEHRKLGSSRGCYLNRACDNTKQQRQLTQLITREGKEPRDQKG